MIHEPAIISTHVKTNKVSSEAFEHEGFIPSKYTCEGASISPPLTVGNFPEATNSLVLIVDDPDAPIRTWTHWIVWNIHPVHAIKEGNTPGIVGVNDLRLNNYSGPCPPSGTHRYFFKVYALNCTLRLPVSTTKYELEKAIGPHIIGYGELIGLYKRVHSK